MEAKRADRGIAAFPGRAVGGLTPCAMNGGVLQDRSTKCGPDHILCWVVQLEATLPLGAAARPRDRTSFTRSHTCAIQRRHGCGGMKVGGRRKLVIPPHLAYGDRSPSPRIKPGETLVFVVVLLEVS